MRDSDKITKNGISVIIPLYNEETTAKDTINRVAETLNEYTFEIIAVNDGSKDNTRAILEELTGSNILAIHHPKNKGYGAALKTGIKASSHDWIAITDADGTYPIEQLPQLMEQMSKSDMVVGSREGNTVADTLPRKIGRGIVRHFASYVCGTKIRDINSGFRVFKKQLANEFWHLFPNGFSFTTTITVASNARGHTVTYIPINYHKRKGVSSIHPLKDFVGFMSLILRLAIYYNPLKVFTPLALGIFVLAWAIVLVGHFKYGTVLDASFAILVIASMQMFMFGLLAEMIVKKFYAK